MTVSTIIITSILFLQLKTLKNWIVWEGAGGDFGPYITMHFYNILVPNVY
jgi:hypothetical protein